MSVTLPTPESNAGKAEWSEVYANDKALRDAVEVLENATNSLTWYTPKVIATEQSRTNTSFGTLGTADEIKEVVLPENGLILVAYSAIWKCSVSTAGRAAVFIGADQLKTNGSVTNAEASHPGTSLVPLASTAGGLAAINLGFEAASTTGETVSVANAGYSGGFSLVFAAAGTYNISVQFKSSSGSVTAKSRKLWVATLG